MNEYVDVQKIYSDFISKFQDEIIYGGYLAALCAPAFVFSASILLNITVDLPILTIAYLIPLSVYSYDYYQDLDKDVITNSERAMYLAKKKSIYPFILGCYMSILVLLLILFGNFSLIIFIMSIFLAGILYNTIFKSLTRKIPAFKNIYTAFNWALAGTFFLFFYYFLSLNLSFILVFFFIFLRCLANIIFFDLKDIKGDDREGLKTLPVILGKKRTIKFLQGLNLFAFVPLIIGIYINIIPFVALSLMSFGFYSYYYLKKAEKVKVKKIRLLSYTLADIEFILWPMVLLVAKNIFYALYLH